MTTESEDDLIGEATASALRAPIVVSAEGILPEDVDQDALRVISRLQRSGFEAYLVGGCVRDLLLGRKPKDFDVATAAHPRQIKRLFRNGRVIGRRFRLVHVLYGEHVIETSTFRREPPPPEDDEGDLLITEDNEYGNGAEDAVRRDFTVNALFFDPFRWEIHDWVGGLADLEASVLRTIGDPEVRFREDPVRILRAIKFATRLGFRIDEGTWEAMCTHADELVRSAPPRVVEEILRLMRSGTSLGAFRMLRASGALKALLPSVDAFLGRRDDPDPAAHDRADTYWRLLEALDADIHAGNEPEASVILAVIFLRVIERRAEELAREGGPPPDLEELAARELEPLAQAARLPRRAVEHAKRAIANQRRFMQTSSKSFRPLLFMHGEDFKESLHLFRLRAAAWGQGWDVYEGWMERYRRALELPAEEIAALRQKKRRRRRGRRRVAGGGLSETPSTPPDLEA